MQSAAVTQPEATPQELAEYKRHVSSQYLYAERMLTTILSKKTFENPCVMIDIDGTIVHPLKINGFRDILPGVKKFLSHCRKSNVDIYFLTYRKEFYRSRTEKLLKDAKLTPYKELIMHSDEEINTIDSKWKKMKSLKDEGHSIVMCIGDNITDLTASTSCNVLISNPWCRTLIKDDTPLNEVQGLGSSTSQPKAGASASHWAESSTRTQPTSSSSSERRKEVFVSEVNKQE